ncbi:DUF1972 domain-containing protein [Cryptosporangium sp. NPDC048952]|uniref:DUF1972 domain-containing protein n=1 Tax=Cryptosporangium sp. NPDC048952 TaxID=3363961 RepID=UPI00371A9721
MKIALIGTRGVPARYGGFETAVEEVGERLAKAGHEVTVYCRGDDRSARYKGMTRVLLPSLRKKITETLSHTALSVGHLARHRTEVAILFNPANAPFLPIFKLLRIPVAVHVDGLDWRRAKWGRFGRRYYLANERLAARLGDVLIADAVGIQDYYRDTYRVASRFVPYGAPTVWEANDRHLHEYDLMAKNYHLVVARMEPENHVHVVVDGYRRSGATMPLVVVGSVPYRSTYQDRVHDAARGDDRIRLLGAIWDSDRLDSLYAGALTYVHGHSVGGTNPSLLRAMGAGARVLAFDVNFNREVAGNTGLFFADANGVRGLIEAAERNVEEAVDAGEKARQRAQERYQWDDVARQYELLCEEIRRS